MQNDTPEPNVPTQTSPPQVPVLGGMKNIQPVSDHIDIDPIAEVKPATLAVTPPTIQVAQAASPATTPTPSEPTASKPALNQAEKAIRRQTIAGIIISVIGLVMLISSLYSIYVLFSAQGSEKDSFGYIAYGIQAIISLGLIFRKEVFRWLLLIFTVFSLLFNIYTAFMESLFTAVSIGVAIAPLFVLFVLATKFVIPIVIIVVLNLPSVKNSFN